MKKIVGIFYNAPFYETSFETGCGGSETWCIQIAKEFVKQGFYVIIFCESEWKISDNGVEYIPLSLFEYRCQYQKFDYFIMTRAFNEYIYGVVSSTGCKNIYLQSHDMCVWNHDIYHEKLMFSELFVDKFPNFKKFIALTEFHKTELMEYNNIPEHMIAIIGNGVDSDVYSSIDSSDIEKDNSILFPTVYSRGGDILVNYVAPLVRKEIPDFEVHLCGYVHNYPEDVPAKEYVKVLGTLSKEEYYKEFYKHKVWFLPCTVVEDFGICAAEAVMCGCEIVSPFLHGMKDVCWPFVDLKMENKFNTVESSEYHRSQYVLNMSQDDLLKVSQEAADRIIDAIRNYDNKDRNNLRKVFKTFILRTHTWENVVKKWIEIF